MQNEWAGAQALSSVDTYLAPFIRHDGLSYKQVKQQMQRLLFNIATPSRWGTQTPFINFTFDWTVPEDLKDQHVIIGGKRKDSKYSEYQKEMDMINKAFMECMMEGDAAGRIFTFPIPTYNITKDFDWDSENAQLLFGMTAKYGTPYFQNFINSSLKPSDVRSMCCRLQLDVRQLKSKTGGLFGSGEKTGSVGVITINLPRLGYISKDKSELLDHVGRLMGLATESLEIKRKEVTKNMKGGLLPYTLEYLGTLDQHFSTIGVNGMNECCMNFLGKDKDITSAEGKEFAVEILDFMRDKLKEFQEATGHIFNLEATPAEGTAYRFAKHDLAEFPDIITAGTKDAPYYTNSSQLPVDHTRDVFEALDHQDILQCKYTGGTVLHGFIGEKISDWKVAREMIRKVMTNYKLPYFSITPTFSICPVHGYISGEHSSCPNEHTEEDLKKYGVEEELVKELKEAKV
jgi:ribonucleoside-triphosphate reductase